MVTENLYLVPQSAFVMVGAVVDYHAEQVKGNKVQDISLAASTQYELVVEDPETAVARTASQVSGNRIGATTVLLTDVHIAGLVANSIPFFWLSTIKDDSQKSVFLTNTQSKRLASVVLDGVLGSLCLEPIEAMHTVRLRVLEGHHVSLQSPSRV